jgi:hypothetical protein
MMRTYLLIDDRSVNFFIGRRTEEELKAELIEGMEVGDIRAMDETGRFSVQRET